jgi:hypothetical protein
MSKSRVPGEDDEPLPDEIDLSSLDADFEQARVAARPPVPDGTYEVAVERAELLRAPRSGDPMLTWTLAILAPACRGRRLWRNLILTPQNLPWLKRDLKTCGLHLGKLSELPHHLDELHDVRLRVVKRTRGAYDNVFFLRRLPA